MSAVSGASSLLEGPQPKLRTAFYDLRSQRSWKRLGAPALPGRTRPTARRASAPTASSPRRASCVRAPRGSVELPGPKVANNSTAPRSEQKALGLMEKPFVSKRSMRLRSHQRAARKSSTAQVSFRLVTIQGKPLSETTRAPPEVGSQKRPRPCWAIPLFPVE